MISLINTPIFNVYKLSNAVLEFLSFDLPFHITVPGETLVDRKLISLLSCHLVKRSFAHCWQTISRASVSFIVEHGGSSFLFSHTVKHAYVSWERRLSKSFGEEHISKNGFWFLFPKGPGFLRPLLSPLMLVLNVE